MSKWITVGESRRKRISMTHSQPQPEQTVAEILGQMAGAVSLCWEPKPTGVFDSEQASKFVDQAQAALNRQALATALRIVGDDETDEDEVANDFFYATRNGLRVQLRQAFTDYYGGGEL